MVVPEAWLSREYARPIQYLLTKLFTLEYVVEDLHRAWFVDAQVKTMLVIARRRSASTQPNRAEVVSTYTHLGIPHQLAHPDSLVGGVDPTSSTAEQSLIDALKSSAGRSRLTDVAVSVQERLHRDLQQEVATASSATWSLRPWRPPCLQANVGLVRRACLPSC
jgi:hypothetical protein